MNNGKWNQLLTQWREKFRRFMVGRYGSDELNRFLVWIFIAILFVKIFVHSGIWYWLELAVIVLIYYRMFSKNTSQRFKENQTYLNLRFRVTEWAKGVRSGKWKEDLEEVKKYRIFKCPNCGQKIRIPRGHGKVSVHCRKCGHDFIGRT